MSVDLAPPYRIQIVEWALMDESNVHFFTAIVIFVANLSTIFLLSITKHGPSYTGQNCKEIHEDAQLK